MAAQAVLTPGGTRNPSSAAFMLPWVEDAHQRFNTSVLKAGPGRARALPRNCCTKRSPWRLFAPKNFRTSNEVILRHVIGNQNSEPAVYALPELPRRPLRASQRDRPSPSVRRSCDLVALILSTPRSDTTASARGAST